MEVVKTTTASWPEEGAAAVAPERISLGRLIVTLFKLRVVSLLLLAAYGGAALGALSTGTFTMGAFLLLTVAGLFSAAGASAINQYLERESDVTMKRTARRPLPTGAIANPRLVLWLGLGMIAGATGLAAIWNVPLAFWVLLGALIYVGVYTIWLKPRTTLNIVIGGAAGSCAVVSGGAAVGAWADPGVWILAALVFVWTPVHFWALALAYREDYATARYPMLPAVVAPPVAARWTALHTLLTAACGVALGIWPVMDPVYLVVVGIGTLPLLRRTVSLLRSPERKTAFPHFHYSNLYLALVLVVLILAGLWR